MLVRKESLKPENFSEAELTTHFGKKCGIDVVTSAGARGMLPRAPSAIASFFPCEP